MILIKNAHVFTPKDIGLNDVLISNGTIIKIEPTITITGLDVDIIEAAGQRLIPGFIDNHVHITGGGGEQGFASRVRPITAEELFDSGITTVIGLLGTDGFSRNMKDLVAKTKALKEEGVSAYCLTGSYQVPVNTLLSSIEEDMMFIEEIIGVGEIAISDHRSSQPTPSELAKVLASTHVGGMLKGVGGVSVVHVGSHKDKLALIKTILKDTSVPVKTILPTHMNRNADLLEEGIACAKDYHLALDFTAYEGNDIISASDAYIKALKSGVPKELVTISSDGFGSLPTFDDAGNLIKMGIASVTSLHASFKVLAQNETLTLEDALYPFTVNNAKRFNLKQKGMIQVGYDADVLLLDDAYDIVKTIAKGVISYKQ